MQDFDIIKQCEIDKTYRVDRILNDFDVKAEHAKENFKGRIELPQEWQIGVIII